MTNKRRSLALALLLALLTTACLPKGIRLPQSDLLKNFERKAGLIAYLGADYNIYTVDQSGDKPAPITTDAHLDSDYLVYGFPVWSPDNNSLAFGGFSGQSGNNPDKAGLFVAGKDGKNLVEAYSSENYLVYYYWSPDSGRVSFIADTPGSSLALKVVSPAGGEAETLDVGSPYYWAWAPDSHSLLIHAGGSAEDRLSLLHLAGGVTEQGLSVKPTSFRAPAYSPDGTQLLVAGETPEGHAGLLLMDANGNLLKTLAEYQETSIAFVWSPDGKRVAYLDGQNTELGFEGRLVVVDPSGKRTPVELKDETATAFFWSPDSASLAYFTPKQVDVPTPAPGTPEGNRPATFTVWSVKVMDASNGQTRPVATYLPTDQFMEVLPFFDQYHQSVTIWSPDSKNLVLSAYTGSGDPGIWVAAASGNLNPRFIATGLVGFWSWK